MMKFVLFLAFTIIITPGVSVKNCTKGNDMMLRLSFQVVLSDNNKVCLTKCGDVYYAEFKTFSSSNHSTIDSLIKFHEKFQNCKTMCNFIKELIEKKQQDINDLDEFLKKLDAYTKTLDNKNVSIKSCAAQYEIFIIASLVFAVSLGMFALCRVIDFYLKVMSFKSKRLLLEKPPMVKDTLHNV